MEEIAITDLKVNFASSKKFIKGKVNHLWHHTDPVRYISPFQKVEIQQFPMRQGTHSNIEVSLYKPWDRINLTKGQIITITQADARTHTDANRGQQGSGLHPCRIVLDETSGMYIYYIHPLVPLHYIT